MGSACVAWSHSVTCSVSLGPCSQSPFRVGQTFQTRPAPEDTSRVSGHRRDRLHQDGRAEYSNVTNSKRPVKGITVQVGRREGSWNEDR
jgi:hypothetical protein